MSVNIKSKQDALRVIREQLETATSTKKCHPCGCFHSTVGALAGSDLADDLAPTIKRAKQIFRAKEYDCLGCPVCFPAIAANAFSEAFPEQGESLDLCPTDAPIERRGWPPLPGDYQVVRYRAPVAVCTLNSEELARRLANEYPVGLALAGTMHTENLGIERLIRNIVANPHIRFLILCGEDTQQAIGHLPGQSLASLFENGIDDRGRIRRAKGKRPVIKNLTHEQIDAFLQQVELVNQIGVDDERALGDSIEDCHRRDPGPFESFVGATDMTAIQADEPRRLVPDRAGFFVVYPDALRGVLAIEHYSNDGVINCVIEGRTPAALYSAAIEGELLTRLDHAAYLGRELALADRSMKTGEPYIQDRAPGELPEGEAEAGPDCGCATPAACGGTK